MFRGGVFVDIAGPQEITWCQPKAARFDRMGPLLQGPGHIPVGAGHARDRVSTGTVSEHSAFYGDVSDSAFLVGQTIGFRRGAIAQCD